MFGIAVVGLAMGGYDSYIVRRDRMTTPFDTRFEMEVDALLGAVLSYILWQSGSLARWVLKS